MVIKEILERKLEGEFDIERFIKRDVVYSVEDYEETLYMLTLERRNSEALYYFHQFLSGFRRITEERAEVFNESIPFYLSPDEIRQKLLRNQLGFLEAREKTIETLINKNPGFRHLLNSSDLDYIKAPYIESLGVDESSIKWRIFPSLDTVYDYIEEGYCVENVYSVGKIPIDLLYYISPDTYAGGITHIMFRNQDSIRDTILSEAILIKKEGEELLC